MEEHASEEPTSGDESGEHDPEESGRRNKLWDVLRLLVSFILIGIILYFIPFRDRVETRDGDVYHGRVIHWEKDPGVVRIKTADGDVKTFHDDEVNFEGERPYHPGLLSTWSTVELKIALPFFLLFPVMYLLTAYRWKLLLEAQGINIVMWRAIQYTWIGLFFNNISLGMTGGDVAKAYLIGRRLKEKAGGLISVVVDRAIGLVALLVLTIFASMFRWNFYPIRMVGITVCIFLLVLFLLGWAVFHPWFRSLSPVVWLKEHLPFTDAFQAADRAVRTYFDKPVVLLKTFGISLFCHCIIIVICIAFGLSLGIQEAGLTDYFVFYPVATAISALPISARGWGVGEMSYVYFFGLVGVSGASALSLSVMIRLSLTLWSIPGGLLTTLPGAGEIDTTNDDGEPKTK